MKLELTLELTAIIIGEAIGVGAHMAELRRTQVGSFTEDNHLSTLQDVTDAYHFYKEDGDESFLRKAYYADGASCRLPAKSSY